MPTLIDNITRRINGGPSLSERLAALMEPLEPTQTTTTLTTTGTNTTWIGTSGTGVTSVTHGSSIMYNPYNYSFPEKYYNIENINIDVLRKFMVKEISFVNDLIEIDDSELNYATLILSVDYDVYKELEIEYILEKVEDYVKENISGLIHCMDPDLDMERLHMRFVPKSTLLEIIKNDKEN